MSAARAEEGRARRGARIRALLGKELRELRKSKMILAGMAVLPTIFVGIMLVINHVTSRAPAPTKTTGFSPPRELAGLDLNTAIQVLLNDQFMFMQLLIPVLLPTIIAAHSVIGEKQARTLEPLLATPLRTWELLVAKTLAAVAPAVLLAWLAYLVSVAGVALLGSATAVRFLLRPLWALGVPLGAPLLGLLSATGTVIISSRVNDVRTAQSLAGVGVVPLVAIGMSVLIGQRFLGMAFLLASLALLIPVNLALLWLATRLFRRETILTRWK